MQENIHPDYRDVVFEDVSNGMRFIVGSTIKTKDMVEIDGVKYPHYKMEVSAYSHPFFTGSKNKIMDTAGRIEKFNKKFEKYKQI